MADRPVRQESKYRALDKRTVKLSTPRNGTAHTCKAAWQYGTVPQGTREDYSRIGRNGLVCGMYRYAGKVQTGRAQGAPADLHGRQARQADRQARQVAFDVAVSRKAGTTPYDQAVRPTALIDQAKWAELLRKS